MREIEIMREIENERNRDMREIDIMREIEMREIEIR